MVGPMSEEMISGNAKRPGGAGGTGEYLIYINIGSSFWKLNGVQCCVYLLSLEQCPTNEIG